MPELFASLVPQAAVGDPNANRQCAHADAGNTFYVGTPLGVPATGRRL
ncbi:MAG: hypothetical protein ACHREM_12935 [Polyangiales bacterium]